MTQSGRLAQALAILERLDGSALDEVTTNLDALHPEIGELAPRFAFSDILGREGIN